MKKLHLGYIVSLVVVLLAITLLWTNRYNILDWSILRNYTPSVAVANLAKDSGMNDYGTRLFYVNDPQISNRETFSDQCKAKVHSIILGCYTNPGIFVFKVDDPRLKGVEEVTSAHEMLHAAYERLSPAERNRIDALTQAAYAQINDAELAKRIEGYKKTDPNVIPNELHSILGTEIRNLSPELEQYYARYFTDRNKIVNLAEAYSKVFIDIQNQVQKYDGNLSLRKAEINRRENALEQLSKNLQTQRSQLDLYLRSNNYATYNAAVNSYNVSVKTYNNELAAVKALIGQYNGIVEARNKLNNDQADLAKNIDSRLDTIQNQ